MNLKNYEFKARVDNVEVYESKLLELNPDFRGLDHQTDTYFNVQKGRLKLREGNIENALINYDREDTLGSRESQVILYRHQPDPALKKILINQLGVKTVVIKKRKIYFIDNVKFHFDNVEGLGNFLEVEAIDTTGEIPIKKLQDQCDHYFRFFGLSQRDLLSQSYSDMIMETGK